MVRDAAGADLTEGGGGGGGGGGGNSGGATWAEAEAQSERGEAGPGGRGEDGGRERRRVAGGDGRRHGCRPAAVAMKEQSIPFTYSTMGKEDAVARSLATCLPPTPPPRPARGSPRATAPAGQLLALAVSQQQPPPPPRAVPLTPRVIRGMWAKGMGNRGRSNWGAQVSSSGRGGRQEQLEEASMGMGIGEVRRTDSFFFFHLEWMTVSGCARGGHRTAGTTIGRRRQGLKTQANPRFIENQKNVKDIFLMFFLQLRDKFL